MSSCSNQLQKQNQKHQEVTLRVQQVFLKADLKIMTRTVNIVCEYVFKSFDSHVEVLLVKAESDKHDRINKKQPENKTHSDSEKSPTDTLSADPCTQDYDKTNLIFKYKTSG